MTTPTITPSVPAAPAGWSPVFEPGQVDVDGIVRDYAFLQPDPLATDPVPLLLVFHGGGGNVGTIANQFGFTALSAPLPFLTVFPQGTDVSAGPREDGVWNSGHGHVGAAVGADDVAFIDRLLVDVAHRASSTGVRVDQSRTWASGFSNGGMMAYRLAAERSQEFAAVVSIAGGIGGDADSTDPGGVHINDPAAHDAEPVSILHIHGLLDEGALYHGGVGSRPSPRADLPVELGVELWAAHNRCRPYPRISTTRAGVMRTWIEGDHGSEVRLLTMPGMGHGVPDNVLDMIIPFLTAHTK